MPCGEIRSSAVTNGPFDGKSRAGSCWAHIRVFPRAGTHKPRRCVAIERPDAIQPAFDALPGVVDEVFPVDSAAVERAKQIVLGHKTLFARDAVHLAAMQIRGVKKILSFDRGFDGFPAVTRLA